MTKRSLLLADGVDYAPFLILSGARTGSTMLSQALHSNPEIICFGEIFNYMLKAIDYRVDGYDKTSRADVELRSKSPTTFLTKQIYRTHGDNVQAVGFKFHYTHFWGHEELLEELIADRPIRIVHLKRQNILRTLVSVRVAEHTGVWQDKPSSPLKDAAQQASDVRRKLTPANAVEALRHPSRAVALVKRSLRPPHPRRKAEREPITITADELTQNFAETDLTMMHYDKLFEDHPLITITYEDMVARQDETLAAVQTFLGVEPRRLTITLRRQNPEPLSELIENYEELRAAFENHTYAWMFED